MKVFLRILQHEAGLESWGMPGKLFSVNKRNPSLPAESRASARNANLAAETQLNGQNQNFLQPVYLGGIFMKIKMKSTRMKFCPVMK